MAASEALSNKNYQRDHRLRNLTQSILLVGGMAVLMSLCAWLIWSWMGIFWVLVAASFMLFLGQRAVPPELVMRLYRAQPLDPRHGKQLYQIITELSSRADLKNTPKIYVVPSLTLNAFATGRTDNAAIAVTEGLLRKLSMRELAGVLAHEISHIHNHDLSIMSLADTISRLTQAMSFAAIVLAIINIPTLFTGDWHISWTAILLLYLAPSIGSLLQLGLSRAREYDADLEGASLTGDPIGLASALNKLERYQGQFWEDLVFPSTRKIPQPSLLRSHPETADRVARLRELTGQMPFPQLDVREEPLVTLVGMGPIEMRPRYRWSGLWF